MSLTVGIHPDQNNKESYSDKWEELLKARGVKVRILNLLADDALEQAAQCDGVMWRWAHNENDKQSAKRILYVIEHYLKKPVYPDTPTSWHFDEKIAQHYLFRALDIPTPRTWLFWNQKDALQWARTAPYPVVFKLSVGASSANVLKINNEREAKRLIHRIFNRGIFPMTMNEYKTRSGIPRSLRELYYFLRRVQHATRYVWTADYPPLNFWWKPEMGYAYFQEFLPDNEYDTRIIVIGNRAWGARRINRPDEFRASGSGEVDFSTEDIDLRTIRLAFEASQKASLACTAYDFLMKGTDLVICEISYTFAQYAPWRDFSGYWTSDMVYHPEDLWPEEAQVEDFLHKIKTSS